MTKAWFGPVLALTLVVPLTAQESPSVSSEVLSSLDTRYTPPACELKGGDFRVSSGATYLSSATNQADPQKRVTLVASGERVILDAIQNYGQGKVAASWYYLGRLSLWKADLVGADSALTKAAQMAPGCQEDISKHRYRVWAGLMGAAAKERKAEHNDAALELYRSANVIYRDSPLAYESMAEVFNSQGKNDSSLAYFGRAAEVPVKGGDANATEVRNQAGFNYGVLLINANRALEAASAFERYLGWVPGDNTAKKALAAAYRASGQPAKAQAIEAELVATAAAAPAGGDLSAEDLFDLGNRQFSDKNYKAAAETFGKLLEKRPRYRDALFNQANAYLALEDGAGLARAARTMLELEPLNEYDYSLLAKGLQLLKDQNGLVSALEQKEALPVSLEVKSFRRGKDGASVQLALTGRQPKDMSGKPLTVTVPSVTFEFMDATGKVVGTADVALPPTLAPGSTKDLSFDLKGADGLDWRYRRK
jgi:tetratricopeptide (TPR) repeat protein